MRKKILVKKFNNLIRTMEIAKAKVISRDENCSPDFKKGSESGADYIIQQVKSLDN